MDAGHIKIPPGGAGGRDAGGRPRHHRLPRVDTETRGESGGGHHASGGEEGRSGGPTAGEGPLAHAGGPAARSGRGRGPQATVLGHWMARARQADVGDNNRCSPPSSDSPATLPHATHSQECFVGPSGRSVTMAGISSSLKVRRRVWHGRCSTIR